MENIDIIQVVLYLVMLLVISKPLGMYIGEVLAGERLMHTTPFLWAETATMRLAGARKDEEMSAWEYISAILFFNLVGFLALFFLLLFQFYLPLNPQGFGAVPFWLAVNTAVSFATNTNWQAYTGENTLSYFTQMVGLGVHNFVSAATGICVIAALARGLTRASSRTLGNFWVDLVRITLFVLLPLSVIWAFALMSQGVIQNFTSYLTAHTLEGAQQILPMGPVASQVAIKQLGSNGGGFFGVNSAHPFENPTPFSNFLEMFAILMIPAALPFAYGRLIKNTKHGAVIFITMFLLFVCSLILTWMSEFAGHPSMNDLPFMEGKEVRFGIANSVIWTVATTVTSNGSVNAMISSFSPLAGGLAIVNMVLGEVVFGGVGSGLYGMVLFILITVFIAGLMVGRSPEYLGKKIEAHEIKLAVMGCLIPGLMILGFTAIAVLTNAGLASLSHKGPHGLSEILYAFASTSQNNGSAFGGLNANTNFYNILSSLAMLIGRFVVLIPVLLIAGSLVEKKYTPPSSGTFPTEGGSFVFLLISTLLIVGGLTFFPALCLGPLMEHFLMMSGRFF